MCVEIEPEFFLASMLYRRDSITLKDVKDYTEKLYSGIPDQRVFVDTGTRSLCLAIEYTREINAVDETICKSDNPGMYNSKSFILQTLGHSLDANTRNLAFKLLNE